MFFSSSCTLPTLYVFNMLYTYLYCLCELYHLIKPFKLMMKSSSPSTVWFPTLFQVSTSSLPACVLHSHDWFSLLFSERSRQIWPAFQNIAIKAPTALQCQLSVGMLQIKCIYLQKGQEALAKWRSAFTFKHLCSAERWICKCKLSMTASIMFEYVIYFSEQFPVHLRKQPLCF